MRIEIDRDLCVGHALCLDAAKGGIDLDDDEIAFVTAAGESMDRATAEMSVRMCPQLAIKIIED